MLRRRASVGENVIVSLKTGLSMKGKRPYTEIPSSLMIYPIPYPSAATGPNPNNLKAGFPQLLVDKMDVPNRL